MYRRCLKRIFDLLLSIIAFLVLSPVFLVVAILVRTKLGKPVLFRQDRPGKKEKIFTLYKFCSMTDKKDNNGELLTDEYRLTRFGKWLRATSLDELPELINIIKGDMSIVGPRPLLVEYLPRYSEEQRQRHDVKPGLTGLAQIKGRNSINWDEKFKYDITYVQNISFLGDIKIILVTIYCVLSRYGINSETSATMEKFVGKEEPHE